MPMPPEIHPAIVAKLAELEDTSEKHAGQLGQHRDQLSRHDAAIQTLREHHTQFTIKLEALQTRLSLTATKADVDGAVNGLLRDALNAVPATEANRINRQNLFWQAVLGLVGIGGLAYSIFRH